MEERQGLGPVPSEGARRATGDGTGRGAEKPLRLSAKTKTEIILRLLRGEDIELLSREFKVTAARISQWRDRFLEAGSKAMKKRESGERDQEISQLREKLGESIMENELLRKKIDRIEVGRLLTLRRSRK